MLFCAMVAAFAAPGAAAAHTALEWSAPAAGDTVPAGLTEIRLRFSGPVETRLTSLVLARNGTELATDPPRPGEPPFRELVLPVPQGLAPGAYTATWRTVGADAHVISGSFGFVVEGRPDAPDPAPLPPADTAPPPAGPVGVEPADPLPVLIRWAGLVSLLGMIGAVAFRFGVLARIPAERELTLVIERAAYGTWYVAIAAAALSAVTLPARLWAQSAALDGTADALDPERLRILIGGTTWGHAWMLQATATVAFFVGLMIVRAPHGRMVGWAGAGFGALLLSAVPALSGHTIAVERWVWLAILSDTLHVLAAGVWLGTLGVLIAAGIPATVYAVGSTRGEAIGELVRLYSTLALVSAAAVVLTGVVNAAIQLGAPADLWETGYGRALLVKLGLVALAGGLGVYNWRTVPLLPAAGATRRLRRSARAELALGLTVILVTAVLIVLPTP